MPRSLARVVAIAALALTLAGAAAVPASAEDPVDPPSPVVVIPDGLPGLPGDIVVDIDAAIAGLTCATASVDVVAIRDAITLRQQAGEDVAGRVAALNAKIAQLDCPTTDPTPDPTADPTATPTTTASPATTTTPAPGRSDRDCRDFDTQAAAQAYFVSIGGSATNNADRLDANGNGIACEDPADDGDTSTVVIPTDDDGSTANTGGDQVGIVPEGSAATGSA